MTTDGSSRRARRRATAAARSARRCPRQSERPALPPIRAAITAAGLDAQEAGGGVVADTGTTVFTTVVGGDTVVNRFAAARAGASRWSRGSRRRRGLGDPGASADPSAAAFALLARLTDPAETWGSTGVTSGTYRPGLPRVRRPGDPGRRPLRARRRPTGRWRRRSRCSARRPRRRSGSTSYGPALSSAPTRQRSPPRSRRCRPGPSFSQAGKAGACGSGRCSPTSCRVRAKRHRPFERRGYRSRGSAQARVDPHHGGPRDRRPWLVGPVSRRQRGSRRGAATQQAPPSYPASPQPSGLQGDPKSSWRDRLSGATVPAIAVLPLRIFLGVTFVYAGLDKLLDPGFFDAANPASIQGQLTEFARVSPIAFLVRPVEPLAVPLGYAIALAEIAIGVGALTGLVFRLAAVGGAALSILFWLTASWTTRPYYFGPDLPYALGWITLALAGDGGLVVPSAIRRIGQSIADGIGPGQPSTGGSRGRRAGRCSSRRPSAGSSSRPASWRPCRWSWPRSPCPSGSCGRPTRRPGGSTGDGASGGDGAGLDGTPATGPSAAAERPGDVVPTLRHDRRVDRGRGQPRLGAHPVPADAPAPLPAGDPGIIVKLPDGSYVAYDATCTHEGCRVDWDAGDGVLLCPCHGAAFDPADHGAVLGGPTNIPLAELPIVVDQTRPGPSAST